MSIGNRVVQWYQGRHPTFARCDYTQNMYSKNVLEYTFCACVPTRAINIAYLKNPLQSGVNGYLPDIKMGIIQHATFTCCAT